MLNGNTQHAIINLFKHLFAVHFVFPDFRVMQPDSLIQNL